MTTAQSIAIIGFIALLFGLAYHALRSDIILEQRIATLEQHLE